MILCVGTMYGIARWYIASEVHKPLAMGVTFIPDYAKSLGLDPVKTMDAILDELHVKHLRLVSYWSDIEDDKGSYDFSQLDWQFNKAESAGAKVSLSIGLRQPRWPECHPPAWVANEPKNVWQPQLETYMKAVIDRYKNRPSLESYQLENEYFNTFGECTDYSRERLISEFNMVKKADPKHPVIISRSNNYGGLPLGKPTPDLFGISVYRRSWDANVTRRYFEYPFPAWYYGFLAGAQKLTTSKDTVLHELQGEAWPPNGQSIDQTSLAEQNKSMDANRLKQTIDFGKATGMRTIDLWGAEYWYYRMNTLHDPSLWNVAKQELK